MNRLVRSTLNYKSAARFANPTRLNIGNESSNQLCSNLWPEWAIQQTLSPRVNDSEGSEMQTIRFPVIPPSTLRSRCGLWFNAAAKVATYDLQACRLEH